MSFFLNNWYYLKSFGLICFFGGGWGIVLVCTVHMSVLNFMSLKLPGIEYSIGTLSK